MKKISTTTSIFFLFISIMVISGCVGSKKEEVNLGNQEEAKEENSRELNMGERRNEMFESNFNKASLNDIQEGQEIVIMGTENKDSSITATRIILDSGNFNFERLDFNNEASAHAEVDIEKNINTETRPSRMQRPDFQNLTQEERESMRHNMMTGGQVNRMFENTTRINGKLLEKNDSSIVIALKEGGSKLIFISEDTTILIPKDEVNN